MTTETIKARFARKPYELGDVLHNSDPSAPAEEIEIEFRKELTESEYDAFVKTMLDDRDWLAGRGGHPNNHKRSVVEVTAPNRTTLFVDPSGSSYGRYVGIAVEAPNEVNDQTSAIRWLINNRKPDISIDQALNTLRFALSSDRAALRLIDQIAAEN